MTDDLPSIPSGMWLRDEDPRFCRWGNGWAVVGREALVWPHKAGEWQNVAFGEHVAERTVRHRSGSYTAYARRRESTRFVVALLRELAEWEGDDAVRDVDRVAENSEWRIAAHDEEE